MPIKQIHATAFQDLGTDRSELQLAASEIHAKKLLRRANLTLTCRNFTKFLRNTLHGTITFIGQSNVQTHFDHSEFFSK